MPGISNQEIRLFYCYAHADKALREKLEIHLSGLKRHYNFTTWSDYEIKPGEDWQQAIHKELSSANIILLLISSDFMASDYCYSTEMKFALERQRTGSACVIPIILRPTDWKNAPFSTLQALPTHGKPITQWTDRDAAFLDAVMGIGRRIDEFMVHANGQVYTSGNGNMIYPNSLSYSVPSTTFSSPNSSLQSVYASNITRSADTKIRLLPVFNIKIFIALFVSYVLGWIFTFPYNVSSSTVNTPTAGGNWEYVLYNIGIIFFCIIILILIVFDW